MTIEVTQADRDAAANLARVMFQVSAGVMAEYLNGHRDQEEFVQAFARHRQSAERGEAWRPIETAPKAGTWFLAYWPVQTFEDRIQTTRWLHGDCRFVDASDFMDHIQPTHWQPLPTPPEAVRTPIEGTSHAD